MSWKNRGKLEREAPQTGSGLRLGFWKGPQAWASAPRLTLEHSRACRAHRERGLRGWGRTQSCRAGSTGGHSEARLGDQGGITPEAGRGDQTGGRESKQNRRKDSRPETGGREERERPGTVAALRWGRLGLAGRPRGTRVSLASSLVKAGQGLGKGAGVSETHDAPPGRSK